MSEMAMFFGESRYIEYKREVPKDSLKYMKSVVAFANGDGGQIIFGVEDNTEKGYWCTCRDLISNDGCVDECRNG